MNKKAKADSEKVYKFIPNVMQDKFLKNYAACGMIKKAAKSAGIDRSTHYLWMEDERYAKAFAAAKQIAMDALEDEAYRRAVDGYKGEHGCTEYSDKLLITLLKANFPDRYKDRVESKVEVSGEVGIVEALKDARERLKNA